MKALFATVAALAVGGIVAVGLGAAGSGRAADPAAQRIDIRSDLTLMVTGQDRSATPALLAGYAAQAAAALDRERLRTQAAQAEALAEGCGHRAHAHAFRPADIQRAGRRRDLAQRAQRLAVGVPLPDHVDMTGGETDRTSSSTRRAMSCSTP